MAGITLADAEAQLAAWLEASLKAATGQEYTMPDGRSLKRVPATEIKASIEFWQARVDRLSGTGGPRVGRITLRDG